MRPALEARLTIQVGRGDGIFVVESELELERGVLVLFGPSGAGKSLTLQALAGLLRPRQGWIRIDGETLFDHDGRIDVPAHRRRIGYVPQQDSLFPFRNVLQNVGFGLRRSERRRAREVVRGLLEELEIEHLAGAYPASLSGGERQRVALARALAVRPRLLLLDEPFASIDRRGRAALQTTLRATLRHHGMPAVLVTHDSDEAAALADTVVCFDRGRTIASGAPGSLLPGREAADPGVAPSGGGEAASSAEPDVRPAEPRPLRAVPDPPPPPRHRR